MNMNEEYQQGIKARREGKARHENPYIGDCGMFTRISRAKDWWDIGWDNEDNHQRKNTRAAT